MAVAAGTSNLYLDRDTKVYLEQGGNLWEIPVLKGFSFNQTANTADVTLSEMSDASGASRRASKRFTTSYAPSEWSFSTYARPYIAATKHRIVEEPLWANFVAVNSYTPATPAWTSGVTYTSTTSLDIDFLASNRVTLGTFNLYFVLGAANAPSANYLADGDTTIYKITGAVINQVAITFDIAGISTLAWSGFGGQKQEITSFDASAAIGGGINQTNNFIRNRLTQLQAISSVSGTSKTYAITLTGGTITIANGITFLTPETLGRVNQPIGHVTGAREVTGSFTAYLDEKTNGTIDLMEDISNATTTITNKFALDFYVGGKAVGDAPVAPGLQFKMPQATLALPTTDIADVVAVTVNFKALASSLSSADEISKISYVGV